MLTILGSLLGFGSSMLPKIFEFFQERADRAHELAIIDRQMEQMKLGSALKLEEINAKADIAIEGAAVYEAIMAINSENFQAMLAAVVSFWFGSRALNRK